MARPKTNIPLRRKRGAPPPLVALDRHAPVPMFLQIYRSLQQSIIAGRISSGNRLPSSRTLAEDLHVARTTVVLAYEHLEAEGYVIGKGSAGTIVADVQLPRETQKTVRNNETPVSATSHFSPLSSRPVPFRIGEPALDAFPTALWSRLYARRARRSGAFLLGYGDSAGYPPLRRAIAEYIAVSRSVRTVTEQVILTRGAQQAMDLVARVLLQTGDRVWVEDPGYLAPRELIELAGAIPVPVPVDDCGLNVEVGIQRAPSAQMVCVAPSHQFPLGRTLSLARRLDLLHWASQSAAWIVEDDYDSEFRYAGAPIASLQGLDSANRVIYVGTFSKTVYPALRLGYLISPPELLDRFCAAKAAMDSISPTIEQATLTDFIQEGHFTRHVRRMRAIYRERQEVLLEAAGRELSGILQMQAAETGMHVVGWLLRRGVDDISVSREAQRHGIETRPLSRYCLHAALPPALVLGFGAVSPRELTSGIRKLRDALMKRK